MYFIYKCFFLRDHFYYVVVVASNCTTTIIVGISYAYVTAAKGLCTPPIRKLHSKEDGSLGWMAGMHVPGRYEDDLLVLPIKTSIIC